MAPRKSAAASAAAGDGQASTLKLIIEKGPAMGTTREFRPGVTVHIGRTVRGNTIAVKDAGISSKHLLFQAGAASWSDCRRWTITDLDSSNGAILNGAKLRPQEPAVLSDGDVIKIGEESSIRVEMVSVAENEASTGVRRNTRRRAREQAADLVAIDEDAELGLQSDGDEGKIEVEVKQGRNVNTRASRSSAKTGNSTKDMDAEEDKYLGPSEIKGSRGVSTRRTRSSKKEANVDEIDLSAIEGKRTTRGGRARKNQPVETISEEPTKEEPKPELKDEKEIADVDKIDLSAIEGKRTTRGGRARKNQPVETISEEPTQEEPKPELKDEKEIADVDKIDLGAIEGKRTTRGGRGRKKQPVETISEEPVKEQPNPELKEETEIADVQVDQPASEAKNSVTEGFATGASSSSAEVQEPNDKSVKVKIVADMENMTLGEWLDYAEEYEIRQIIDETEELLNEMVRKAERCHEYMLEQTKKQGS